MAGVLDVDVGLWGRGGHVVGFGDAVLDIGGYMVIDVGV